jgi:hypothetical protein
MIGDNNHEWWVNKDLEEGDPGLIKVLSWHSLGETERITNSAEIRNEYLLNNNLSSCRHNNLVGDRG